MEGRTRKMKISMKGRLRKKEECERGNKKN